VQAIAPVDFFGQFDRTNMLARGIARNYRDTILAPGGSKPARQLVRDFLGRETDFKAWQSWLNEGD
jgi:thimet oligopeptidase